MFVFKEPLFSRYDNNAEQNLQSIEGSRITIPISYSLLEQLNTSFENSSSITPVKQLTKAIVSSTDYVFPEYPLYFDRQDELSLFVPDDNLPHIINWNSLILQVHISFLETLCWLGVPFRNLSTKAQNHKSISMIIPQSQQDHNNKQEYIGSRSTITTGSISFREQSRYVSSFSNRSQIGSFGSSNLGSIHVDVAPQINRPKSNDSLSFLTDEDIDIDPLCELDFTLSFDNDMFRSIILAISSRGSLDIPLGYKILRELHDSLDGSRITLPSTLSFDYTNSSTDCDSFFDAYHKSLHRTLLSSDSEDSILEDLARDSVSSVLDTLEALQPFDLLPHSQSFIEGIFAPLCYHEDPSLAWRAIQLYLTLLNGHSWDLKESQVCPREAPLPIAKSEGHAVIIAASGSDGLVYTTVLPPGSSKFIPRGAGFYDWVYARPKAGGGYDLEIDTTIPAQRAIVLPESARKEVIHELPAFDDRGPVLFTDLISYLEDLAADGVTAVHIAGAFERTSVHELTTVTDHTVFSKACGGIEGFKELAEKASSYGIRVLADFLPLVSVTGSSRKYSQYTTLQCDQEGRLLTSNVPGTHDLLLNLRSTKLWSIYADEMKTLSTEANVSGFFLGPYSMWDYVLPRDHNELDRIDVDGERHYPCLNIIEGTIIQTSNRRSCGIATHVPRAHPFISKLLRSLWAVNPDAFVWIDCSKTPQLAGMLAESGVVPQLNDLHSFISDVATPCTHIDQILDIHASTPFHNFFKSRNKILPKNALVVSPFCSLTQGDYNRSHEEFDIATHLLFYLSDVPLISSCLKNAYYTPAAYLTDRSEIDGTFAELKFKCRKYYPPASHFAETLKQAASACRMRGDWVVQGDWKCLPVTYDSKPNDAVIAISRTDPITGRCAVICQGFFMSSLIFEVGLHMLSILSGLPQNSIIEVKPLLSTGADLKTTYYSLEELAEEGSTLFVEVGKFGCAVFEIVPLKPPIPSVTKRTLMEGVFERLERAMDHNSFSVLSHNYIFNNIIEMVESPNPPSDMDIIKLLKSLPNGVEIPEIFRKALFFATRFTRSKVIGETKNQITILRELNTDNEILPRENAVLGFMERALNLKDPFIREFSSALVHSNELGPILFVTPELGPFSKVGGLSTMVWELAKELVNLGLDIHVVSPYYNVNPKGETGYLSKYGIELTNMIEVYCPDRVELGIHYGVVDGVKCWFLHNYTYFAVPYQTGPASFRMQTLVIMARASLELCCQERMLPSLIVTNDWMTGLTAAYARNSFGNTFNGTRFLHIFHNLGIGYAGKLWAPDGNVTALQSIHQLPEELIVDPYDHSIDPSRCALLATDQWATVSKQYRKELLEGSPYSYFLKQFPMPFAYSNGIRFKERLEALSKLGMDHRQAKATLQQKYFGEADESKCVFVFVGRIVEQKGVYLIVDSFEELNQKYNGKLQFIVGGQANPDDRTYGIPCTQRMIDLKNRYPKQFWADPSAFFTDGLLACQGADYTLVPSLFEPSGIVQQESFASGTPVIAFKTGGLADTVFEFDKEKLTGNGFNFLAHRHKDYAMAVERAADLFNLHKDLYLKLRENAFKSTLSTDTVARAWAREFARLFTKVFEPPEELPKLKVQ